jgi:hypothetical protein
MSITLYAHVLLFECPVCGRPLSSACASNTENLEPADGKWFTPHCHCGWTGDVIGVSAREHWVAKWNKDVPISSDDPSSCDDEVLRD